MSISRARHVGHGGEIAHDFLADLGFLPVRWIGRVEPARLGLGGLVPVLEGRRADMLRRLKEVFAPAPAPQRL